MLTFRDQNLGSLKKAERLFMYRPRYFERGIRGSLTTSEFISIINSLRSRDNSGASQLCLCVRPGNTQSNQNRPQAIDRRGMPVKRG